MSLCRHCHEIFRRFPDGTPGLECVGCFRLRRHPWLPLDYTPQTPEIGNQIEQVIERLELQNR